MQDSCCAEGSLHSADLAPLEAVLKKHAGRKGGLIPILQEAQELYGFLSHPVMERIAEAIGAPPAEVYGVATFYTQFRFSPVGKNLVRVCHGTACHVAGAGRISDSLQDELGIEPGGTTADGLFTMETVACLGCCSLAPVMMVGEETHGRLDDGSVRRIVREIRRECGCAKAAAEAGGEA